MKEHLIKSAITFEEITKQLEIKEKELENTKKQLESSKTDKGKLEAKVILLGKQIYRMQVDVDAAERMMIEELNLKEPDYNIEI